MEADKISVIVTVYNVKRYLQNCLDSISCQTFHNLEIILVDDGSTDGSAEICDRCAEKDSRVKVIHKKNEGLVRARKTGIQSATGKYVGYVDADDWIEPDMYQKLYERLCEVKADIVVAGRIEEYIDRSVICKNRVKSGVYTGNKLKELYSKMLFEGTYYEFGIYPTVWDKLFKKDLLQRNQRQVPDDIVIGEDVACVYPSLLEAESVYVMNECFYHYRKREGSMLSQRDNGYNKRIIILWKYLYERFQTTLYWEVLEPQLEIYFMYMITGNTAGKYNIEAFNPEYLFPFQLVGRANRVVLYGAGIVGKIYYRQIQRSRYCELVGWVDKNADKYQHSPYLINYPSEIKNIDFNQIVISVKKETTARAIMKNLKDMGVDSEKIVWAEPGY